MKDICVRWKRPDKPKAGFYGAEITKFTKDKILYQKWMKENLPSTDYYISQRNRDCAYFLNEDDLTAFTLKFGHVYAVEPAPDDGIMSKIERMVVHETALQRYNEESLSRSLERFRNESKD